VHKLRVTVFEEDRELWSGEVSPPLEIGRQQEGDPSAMELQDQLAYRRLVMAPVAARGIPRQAIRIESPSRTQMRVVNMHTRLTFGIGDTGELLPPGQIHLCDQTARVLLPERRAVQVSIIDESLSISDSSIPGGANSNFRTIAVGPNVLGGTSPAKLRKVLDGDHGEMRGRAAVDLVRSALEVVRQAAGSDGFFDAACTAAANMIDLDRVMVLLYEGGNWRPRAVKLTDPDTGVDTNNLKFSDGLIARVLRTGKTVIYDPNNYMHSAGSSLMMLERAVASPITDEQGKPIGVLYGDRELGGTADGNAIGELEAALLEVLAGAVSSGLARQREEQRRASLTQFFSPRIAEQLECNQDLLTGQDAEVTVLFCDIRGFSAVAERVGPQRTIQWINEVLTELSLCVMRHDGVLVDYVGDELMAMWGAPGSQPDHAERACMAACEMLSQMEPLKKRFHEITPDGFGFGIGINTGMARVGNTGSKIKFKYGPLGNVVNVASRVQGVTKQSGVRALITASTAAAIAGKAFDLRRLATVEVVGIKEPITLLQLAHQEASTWRSMRDKYETSLTLFEKGDYSGAARQLATLVHDFPEDQPSLILLGRVVEALTDRSKPADPVWHLRIK
jgi:adenylate cyclase